MKKLFFLNLLLIFIISFLSFFSLFSLFNYFIDPYFFFRTNHNNSYEKEIALKILNNEKVIVSELWNEDIVRYFQILNAPKKSAIVVGSSRAHKISSDLVGYDLMIYSIGASGLEDRISIVYSIKQQYKPKMIIIEIDPWVFSKNFDYIRPNFIPSYLESLSRLNQDITFLQKISFIKRKYFYLLDPKIFLLSIKYSYYNLVKHNHFLVNTNNDSFYKYMPDGTLVYPEKYEKMTEEEINRTALKLTEESNKNDNTEKNYIFSQYKYDTFVKFVNDISNDSKITLLILPFHPLVYEKIKERTKDYFISEKLLRENKFLNDNIKVVGTFSPYGYHCGNEEFYDHMHVRESCIKKILNK